MYAYIVQYGIWKEVISPQSGSCPEAQILNSEILYVYFDKRMPRGQVPNYAFEAMEAWLWEPRTLKSFSRERKQSQLDSFSIDRDLIAS